MRAKSASAAEAESEVRAGIAQAVRFCTTPITEPISCNANRETNEQTNQQTNERETVQRNALRWSVVLCVCAGGCHPAACDYSIPPLASTTSTFRGAARRIERTNEQQANEKEREREIERTHKRNE